MARLRHRGSGRELTLTPEHVVGRSSGAALRLDFPFISLQHAALRWTGQRWEGRDLGSRNGTWVNGVRLVPSQPCILRKGDVVGFGDSSQEWTLEDDASPGVMVVALDGGEAVATHAGVLAIPSADAPEVTVYSGADGAWHLEREDDAEITLINGQIFEAARRTWRFCCPELVANTTSPDEGREIKAIRLLLSVARDEEHVELRAECSGRIQDLGSRAHNYLLLTLARARLKDAAAGVPDTACGWMYLEELTEGLGVPATQLNIDVFRIRKQFAALDLVDPANIIERRPRTKQLRVGAPRITIATI